MDAVLEFDDLDSGDDDSPAVAHLSSLPSGTSAPVFSLCGSVTSGSTGG